MSINQEDRYCLSVLPIRHNILPIKQNIFPIVNSDPNIIEVREFNNKRFFLKITNFLISVMELKKIIQNELDYIQYNLVLYSNGNYLDDSKKLIDYNITYKSIIHVILTENKHMDHIIINVY